MTMSEDETLEAAHWNTVRGLFHQARELAASERDELLTEKCQGDAALRKMVEDLLEADQKSDDFLESPVALQSLNGLEEGHQVGPFKIIERIGSGNMGEVYRAQRNGDFHMSVALKVVDAAKVDQELIWRFKHERQILASLDHPNIARIIDGGTLEDGRPWFALEYVEGERIDRYCDRLKLSIRERIQLFRKVCAAVSEAHANAIVHRDLKPANILVGQDGEPKLLDFGIAAPAEGDSVSEEAETLVAIQDSQAGEGRQVDTGALTPLYASPEQAMRFLEPECAAHTTVGVRSDVYSLGVVLYELMTGHPPYKRTRPWPAVLSSVVTEVPKPPSKVVLSQRELKPARILKPESVAESRGLRPHSLALRLEGDLDVVISRALAKDQDRRYQSVAHFDADLEAHLDGYPVASRRSERIYRARLFLRRNYPTVATTVAALSLLALMTVFMIIYNREQVRETWNKAHGSAILALGGGVDAREVRDLFDAADDSEQLAEHLTEIGFDLEDRGNLRGALAYFQVSLEVGERILGPDHWELAPYYNNLAGAKVRLGDFESAEWFYLEALYRLEQRFGADAAETDRTLNNLATLYQDWGREHLPQARELLEKAMAIREKKYQRLLDEDPDSKDMLRAFVGMLATRHNLATQDLLEENFGQAELSFTELLEDLDRLPASGIREQNRARILRNRSLARLHQGKSKLAEQDAKEMLRILRRHFLSWKIADGESVLGASLAGQGRLLEARSLLEQAALDLRVSQPADSRHAREAEERLRWLEGFGD